MNNYEKINELHKLLESGNITQSEFDGLKKTLLNEQVITHKQSSAPNPGSIKLLKRLSLFVVTLAYIAIAAFTEFKDNESFVGIEDNFQRSAVNAVVAGSIAFGLTAIGVSIGAGFGPAGILVGALLFGSAGYFGLPLGEEVSDAIWGEEDRSRKYTGSGDSYAVNDGQPPFQPVQKSEYTKKSIRQKLENNELSAYQIGGSYEFGSDAEVEAVGSLLVYPLSEESAYFFVSVCIGAPSYNLGDMFGLMKKSSRNGEFYSDGKNSYFDCKLTFKFFGNKVKITTDESTPCEFGGSGVSANYTYTLSDKNIPKTFTNNENKTFRFDKTTLKSYYK